jgi:PAS domain S-box-containing protein
MKRRAAPASATTAKGLAWNGPEAFPRRTDAMRFRARIGLIVVTFVLLTSLVVALAVFNLFEQRQQQEYQTWTRTLSAALAKSVFRDTLEGNRAEVANLLKRVAADNPQIAYILVVDFSGQPFASTFKEGMGVPTEIMAPRQGTDGSNQVLYVNGHEILDISYPIVENLNAHLHVGLDAEIQHKSRLELIRAIASSAAAILLVGLVAALFFARRATRPLTQLAHSLRAYGQGEEIPLPDMRNADAEVVELAASFRDMIKARRAARDALEVAERQLRMITDGLPVGIAYLDAAYRFQFANQTFETWYQCPREQIIGRHPREILGEQMFARFDPYVERALAGERVSADVSLDYPDGVYRHVNAEYVPDLENGRVRGLIVLITDISARVEAAQQLLMKDAAIENSLNAIAIADPQGNLIYVNGAFLHLWGYGSPNQVLGRAATAFWTAPDEAVEVVSGLQRDGYWTGEMEAVRADGRTFIADLSAVLIRNNRGEPTHMLGSFIDITQRKHAEKELRRYQEHLEELVKARTAELQEAQRIGHMGNWTWDIVSGKITWSDEIYHIFGRDQETFSPTFELFMATVHPQDVEPLKHGIQETLARTRHSMDHRILLPDGEVRWVNVAGVAAFDESGNPIGISGTLQDITERKRIEEALIRAKEEAERSSRAKSDFLSRMSHELRTPMNAILGFAQVLEVEPLSAEQQSFVHEIHQAGDHLLELINDLLDLSRIDSGRLETALQALALGPVAAEAIQLVGPLLQQREVTLIKQCTPNIAVLADATRLKQILVNLLSNAAKYNRQGGSIRIDCHAVDADKVRFSVTDTGPGIAPDKLELLFKPFERLGAEFTAVEGAGIGLAISKRLAELMGGALGVDSTPGQGSTFWIELPLAQSPQQAAAALPAAAPEVAQGTHKILYVEDNAANLKVVEALLRRQPNLTLLTASNGEYGLELARRYLPDVILLDIHLPGMDGYAVLKALRAQPETRGIPVIALSADAMPIDVERGLAAGFRDYLTKPVMMNELMRAIERWLKPAGPLEPQSAKL